MTQTRWGLAAQRAKCCVYHTLLLICANCMPSCKNLKMATWRRSWWRSKCHSMYECHVRDYKRCDDNVRVNDPHI